MEKLTSDRYWTKGIWRGKALFAFLKPVFRVFLKYFFDYSVDPYTPKDDVFLVVTNHNSTADHFLNAVGITKYMRYVVSDHLFRKGFLSCLLRFFLKPIPRRKGGKGEPTREMIKQNLRLGIPVILYVEGNRSFNGKTGFTYPRTGQMIKEVGRGSLVTFRIEGAYLQTPRWAEHKRKGPIFGYAVHEYPREELNQMTADEINRLIYRDICENAYAHQRKVMRPYPGKALAEHLETAIFTCPKCGKMDTLKSRGNEFFCTCGMKTRLNEYGFFEGGDLPFDNVYSWDKWQNEAFLNRVDCLIAQNALVTQDKGISLYEVNGCKKKRVMKNACLSLYADRLEFACGDEKRVFFLSDIPQMGVAHTQFLYISVKDGYYEVRCDHLWSARKYFALHRMLLKLEYV